MQAESEHKGYLERVEALNELLNKKDHQISDMKKQYDALKTGYDSIIKTGNLDPKVDLPVAKKSAMQSAVNEDILSMPELVDLENFIVDNVLQKNAGETFSFSSLIPHETWSLYASDRKSALEESFRLGVEKRRYPNVKQISSLFDDEEKYTILDFPEYKDSDLILDFLLRKIAASKSKTVQPNELRAWRDWNYHLLKKGIAYLLEKRFVESVINNGRPSYRLTKEGELYLSGK